MSSNPTSTARSAPITLSPHYEWRRQLEYGSVHPVPGTVTYNAKNANKFDILNEEVYAATLIVKVFNL